MVGRWDVRLTSGPGGPPGPGSAGPARPTRSTRPDRMTNGQHPDRLVVGRDTKGVPHGGRL